MNESQIVEFTKKKLEDRGGRVFIQVPFLSRCIDMVILSGEEIISIEFKLHNWRKAIQQSKDHLLGVDKAYICLPERKNINKELEIHLREYGIGLYFFYPNEEPLREAVPAQKSQLVWSTSKQWLINTLYAK